MYCIHIREDKTILYFSDDSYRLIGGAPLAFQPLEVNIYHGYNSIGIMKRGWVWCTTWWYSTKFGYLKILCQIEED